MPHEEEQDLSRFIRSTTGFGKVRFTLGEMLVGIVLLAIPLAYWTSNVRRYRYVQPSSSHQKALAANPKLALSFQKLNVSMNLYRLNSYKIT